MITEIDIMDDTKEENFTVIPEKIKFSEDYILLNLNFRIFGDTVKADKAEIIVDSNKDLLSLSKKLLDCPELDAIKSFSQIVTREIKSLTLPAHKTFKAGFYRVPPGLADGINQYLLEKKQEFRELILNFLNAYDYAKYKASLPKSEGGLGCLYREEDYPTLEEIEDKFSMGWSFLSVSVPENLPAKLAAQEAQKFQESLIAAKEECIEALRVGFAELVNHAAERLQSREDGKPQRFTASVIEKLGDFVATFSFRNSIGNDEQLAALVNKARKVLSVCPDVTILRKEPEIRERIQSQFQEIVNLIETTELIPAKGRAINI